ncbi:MAG TPA: glycine--tRNA ligase [Bacillota bacterium]|nr:glycine--tRNA ligase [Bacillota bacterium]HPF42757.1 glycine--tRNA ligase [Bacillota bacterium]HPJ85973.1 glycine--tRNA ligase [Bacillota bacterium]HPQ62006.1 glycine--tRNA ligase [Bacillota bacterium]HRX91750.1 glycine--tRNA ligase [Candidatus Izemoplasmatales bacterium]
MIDLANTLDQLVNYCKQYGFIFQGSEIYGGLANSWDYGPLGVELKNNIKKAWWEKFVARNPYNVGLDSGIILHTNAWIASGHVKSFQDPLMDCKECKSRHRADKLIEAHSKGKVDADGWSRDEMLRYINDNKVKCPVCGAFNYTDIRQFNLMFKTHQGVIEDEQSQVYLRPETAQGIFLDFKNVLRVSRKKIPFGIGQIGKAFRNEITPGNFVFRTREFEQMELEFFCKPHTELEWFAYWKDFAQKFLLSLGLDPEHIRFHDHPKEKLSFYSNATTDILYQFPWGFDELWGIASRTDYDLGRHQENSGENLEYLDPDTNEKYLPYVIEPSLGVERLLLAILNDALTEETVESTGETRTLLKIDKHLAPYQVAVLPLVKKYHQEKSNAVFNMLINDFSAVYDDTGNIGRRYRRQDAIGTPYAVTIDDTTESEGTVTIRDRDSMSQVVIAVAELSDYLKKQF